MLMKLTEEQRKLGRKSCILNILADDIKTKRFEDIQKLCESANIRNQELVNQLTKDRNIGHSFVDMIYFDLIMILVEKIMASSELEDVFQKLYEVRFAKVKTIFDKYKQQYENTRTNSKDIEKLILNLDELELQFFSYNLYKYDLDWFVEKYLEMAIQTMNYKFYLNDFSYMEQVEKKFVFEGTEESVFTSTLFEKYIAKRKQELADFLGIQVDELEKKIHNEMKSHVEVTGTPLKEGVYGKIENATKSIISRNKGGINWYEQITYTKKTMDFLGDINQMSMLLSMITIGHWFWQNMLIIRKRKYHLIN